MKTETLLAVLQSIALVIGGLFLAFSAKRRQILVPALVLGYAAWCGTYQVSMIYTLITYARSSQGYFPGFTNLLTSIIWDILPLKVWWLQFPASMYKGFDWFPIIRYSLLCTGGFVITVLAAAKLIRNHEKSGTLQTDSLPKQTARKTLQNYPTWFIYFLCMYLSAGILQAGNLLTLKNASQTGSAVLAFTSLLFALGYFVVFALFGAATTRYAIEADKTQGRCEARAHNCVFKTAGWGNFIL